MMATSKLTLALLILLVINGCTTESDDSPERYSVLIINGTVYDGSMAPATNVNIGINDDRIASMDAGADAGADLVIDASGLAVVPGFIDPHTHAGSDLLDDTRKSNINFLTQGVTTVFIGSDGGGMTDRERQIATMQEQGTGPSVGYFSGHGMVRSAILGMDARAPTEEELQQMRDLVEADMRAGALGLSTGLYYAPGSYSETGEVIELAKIAARYGGVYDSHMRDESSYNIGLLGAIREVIEIGEAANIPVHIAHIKALGRDVWGQSGDVIGLVAAARERGVEITADQYPYRASGTSFGGALVPRWVMADSRETMSARFANPDLEDRIREEMSANLFRRGGAESLLVTGDSEWRGLTLEQIAERMNTDAITAAIAVVEGGDPSVASFNMQASDIDALAIQDWVMTGSDGSTGHPRKFGTYPTAYQDFVVAKSLMSEERFVHRSSGLVADAFYLCDRGYLEPGRKADIAILNLANYRPISDFENPTELSTGVTHLLVNGRAAITDGQYAGTLPGSVIDRQNLDCPE